MADKYQFYRYALIYLTISQLISIIFFVIKSNAEMNVLCMCLCAHTCLYLQANFLPVYSFIFILI